MSINPWPGGTIPHRAALLEEIARLENLFEVLINEGVNHRDYGLVRELIGKAGPRIKSARRLILAIEAQDGRQQGRIPRWLSVTRQVKRLLIRLGSGYEVLERAVRRNDWSVVAARLNECRRLCEQISERLASVPEPIPLSLVKAG